MARPPGAEPGDGNSVAAWTGVLILLAGAVLISAGMLLDLSWAIWIGVGAVVVGVIAWVALHKAGYGESSPGSH